jgi:asparagine synthase (glutamine-hydrolysing)
MTPGTGLAPAAPDAVIIPRFLGVHDGAAFGVLLMLAAPPDDLAGAIRGGLAGPIATAVPDTDGRTVHLVRDAFGVASLYYAEVKGGYVFASSIVALLASGLCTARPDWDSLHRGLALWGSREPLTAFQGIFEARSGCLTALTPGRSPRETEYWRIPAGIPRRPTTLAGAAEELDQHLRRTLHRSIAGRRVLCALSGGLDSATILGILAQLTTDARPTAITLTAPALSYSELRPASATAAHLTCPQEHLELSIEAIAEDFDRTVDAVEEPNDHLELIFPLGRKAAALGATTLVLGNAAGGLVGGSPSERAYFFRWLPLRRLAAAAPLLPRAGRLAYMKNVLRSRDAADLFYNLACDARGRIDRPLFAPDVFTTTRSTREVFVEQLRRVVTDAHDPSHHLLTATLQVTVRNGVRCSTKCLAAHGIEASFPWLDVDLIAFLYALPDPIRTKYKVPKPVARELAKRYAAPLAFETKHGFGVRPPAYATLLAAEPFASLVRERLARLQRRGIVRPETVRTATPAHRFYLASVETWLASFVDGKHPLLRAARAP